MHPNKSIPPSYTNAEGHIFDTYRSLLFGGLGQNLEWQPVAADLLSKVSILHEKKSLQVSYAIPELQGGKACLRALSRICCSMQVLHCRCGQVCVRSVPIQGMHPEGWRVSYQPRAVEGLSGQVLDHAVQRRPALLEWTPAQHDCESPLPAFLCLSASWPGMRECCEHSSEQHW